MRTALQLAAVVVVALAVWLWGFDGARMLESWAAEGQRAAQSGMAQGLRALRHETGVLMPEEYILKRFHDWVRAELERA